MIEEIVDALQAVARAHAGLTTELTAIVAQRNALIRSAYDAGIHLRRIGNLVGLHWTQVGRILDHTPSDGRRVGQTELRATLAEWRLIYDLVVERGDHPPGDDWAENARRGIAIIEAAIDGEYVPPGDIMAFRDALDVVIAWRLETYGFDQSARNRPRWDYLLDRLTLDMSDDPDLPGGRPVG